MTPTALSDITVLDLTRVRAGPTAVRQLADWGANVIKVEAPPHTKEGGNDMFGDRHGNDFQNIHRNKRGMTLNLKTDQGVEILKHMSKTADVVVENYRSDVKHRLGIDYESLRAVNPRLVYGSISGFGQDGPYGNRPGVDQIAQGMGGLMSITGEPGRGPMRVGIPIADLTAGLYCAIGILVALHERQTSGEGQWVQTSLLQAQIAMLDFQAARWLIDGEVAGQAGNDHPTSIPTGVFPTSDGHINIAAAGSIIFERFCRAIGADGLLEDPRFADHQGRSDNRAELNERIGAITGTNTKAHWVELLTEAGVPSGPINDISQTFADPQVNHLGMAAKVDHPKLGSQSVVGQGVSLNRTPFAVRRPTPEQGEHTREILTEFGYSENEIAAFRDTGII